MVAPRKAVYAEESAEVEVLFANLDKLNGLTKKIQGSLNRLETSGKNIQTAMGPINGSTRSLKQIHTNVDQVMAVINRYQAPKEQRDQEESIIRSDPRKVGLQDYLASLQRADQVLRGLRSSNMSANQNALRETTALVKYGMRQLEEIFKQTLLNTGASNPLEPLSYITKEKLFPIIPREEGPALNAINGFIAMSSARGSQTNLTDLYSTAKLFADIRGSYVARSLSNLAAATLSTSRRTNQDSIYRKGDCSISAYKVALHGMLAAEYDNIRMIFAKEEHAKVLAATSRPALQDFGKTLRELNNIIQENLMLDCYLAFEILEVVGKMAMQFDQMAGPEMRKPIVELLQPIRDTAKTSIAKFLENTKGQVQKLSMLPQDGAAIPLTIDVVKGLQSLCGFMSPVVSVMSSVGEGNWGQIPSSPSSSTAPSIRSFDTTLAGSGSGGQLEGSQIFQKFCGDVLETLVASLDSRSRLLLKTLAVQAIFMLNNVAIIEGMINSSDLAAILNPGDDRGVQSRIDTWKSKFLKLYLQTWLPASQPLMDVQYTNRNRSSTATMNKDSSAIVAAMPSREKESTKEKFRSFTMIFDDLVAKHKSYKMEREVKAMLSEELTKVVEPLYTRFWDRYHEVDRKGKYVKYDKQALAAQLQSL